MEFERSFFCFRKLDGRNYVTWKRDCEMYLRERGLFGLVEGTEAAPEIATDQQQQESQRRIYHDRKAKTLAIIYLSLEDNLKSLLTSINDPESAWTSLKEIYEPKSKARIANLWTQFHSLKIAEGESIGLFYARMTALVQDLKEAGKIVANDDVGYNLIAHLPLEYDGVVQSLYRLKDEEFKPEAIRAALLAEEGRLCSRNHPQIEQRSSILYSHAGGTQKRQDRERQGFHGQCFNCGQSGHLKRDCKTHLKSSNQVEKQDIRDQTSNVQSRGRGRWKQKGFSHNTSSNRNKGITQQQSQHVTNLHLPTSDHSQDPQNYFLGAFHQSTGYVPFPGFSDEWILDSGATDHFTFSKHWFSSMRDIEDRKVTQGKGHVVTKAVGTVGLRLIDSDNNEVVLNLENVYYVPDMSRNLISLSAIDRHGYSVNISNSKLTIVNPSNIQIMSVREKDRLYSIAATPVKLDSVTSLPNGRGYTMQVFNTSLLWHQRLGHLGIEKIKKTVNNDAVEGIKDISSRTQNCSSCKIAKATRASFAPLTQRRSKRAGELIHSDLWGPSPVMSDSGYRYYLSFVDDYSRWTVIVLLKSKDATFNAFVDFHNSFKRKFQTDITYLRTDNGLEFTSHRFENYCKDNGINHEHTSVYSPESNGVAERVNRTILEGVRTLMIESKLPLRFWTEALLTFVHVKNRLLVAGNDQATPYELWYGYKPNVSYLKRFGCLAYLHIPRQKRNKLQPRAIQGIMLGYAVHTRGYRVYDPVKQVVVETKHVTFDEVSNAFHLLPGLELNDHRSDISRFVYVNMNEDSYENANITNVHENRQYDELDDHIDQRNDNPQLTWQKLEVPRKSGASAGVIDTYYIPVLNGIEGKRLRSKVEIKSFCDNLGVQINLSNFEFKAKKANIRTTLNQEIVQEPIPHQIEQNVSETKTDHNYCHGNYNLCAYDTSMDVPGSYQEAISSKDSDHWKKAMDSEIDTMTERQVWEYVSRPENHRVITNRWVFAKKKDAQGNIKKYKARLVAHGNKQTLGLDWFDSFSPVADFKVVKLLFVLLVCTLGWIDVHIDVKCAYLYANLEENIYMEQPNGYELPNTKGMVCKIRKAIYGLKQAGRAWYSHLKQQLISLGFSPLKWAECVYQFEWKVIICIYVDDFALFAIDQKHLDIILEKLTNIFQFDCLGPITYFLGIEFERKNGQIFLHQQGFIEKLAKKFNVHILQSQVPLETGVSLIANKHPPSEDDLHFQKQIPYREIIGSLLFLSSRSRPDIQFAVTVLSQYCSNPNKEHWFMLQKLLSYVVGTKNYRIFLSMTQGVKLVFYADASWGLDLNDRKSYSGFIWFFGGVPMGWSSNKQKSVSRSTMEAEYVALDSCVVELIWITRIIKELKNMPVQFTTPILNCDNQSAIFHVKNPSQGGRAKHIDIKYHFIRELYDENAFNLLYVPTQNNLADIMSKPLVKVKIKEFCDSVFYQEISVK